MNVLVTGAAGFMGKHAVLALQRRGDHVVSFDIDDDLSSVDFKTLDAVVHLAGANRPPDPSGFDQTNRGLTEDLAARLSAANSEARVLFSSSTQATLDNAYGVSKQAGEEALIKLAASNGNPVVIFRFPNVFGKWARPNYNSAIATFCHNIAKGLPIQVNEPAREMVLVYIDDVVQLILNALDGSFTRGEVTRPEIHPTYSILLGELADRIQSFAGIRTTLHLPDFADELTRKLYASYISYIDGPLREYGLDLKTDPRGCLAELLKSAHFGQIFISRTKPGITRGNHYHHTKIEKFLVVEGEAIIRFRKVDTAEVEEHRVTGTDWRIVDITPGWVHSIENVGSGDLITLFWSDEIFDPTKPDTYAEAVL